MSNTIIDDLLRQVATWLGKDDGTLALDSDNQVLVEVGEVGQAVALDYHEDEGRLVLSCIITSPPESGEAALWEAMLRANFLWQDTYGATLCLSPSGELPVLQHRVDLNILGGPELIGLIEGMANLALQLSDELTEAAAEIGADDTSVMDMPVPSAGGQYLIRG